jgi:hypothetical protein
MQQPKSLSFSRSNEILIKNGWNSQKELFDQLDDLKPEEYTFRKLGAKPVFIYKLKKLIAQVDLMGDIAQETRKMVEPGSIFESMSSNYLEIRNEYLIKRKLLRSKLVEIKTLLT